MALQFTDEEFQEACKELDEPQLDGGWEFFLDIKDVMIYRRYDQGSGLYEYKVFGTMKECEFDLCAAVYMDLEYRKKWDSYVKELCETGGEDQKVIYWEVNYPFPLQNRDYVYIRERRDLEVDGRRICVVLARSHSSSETVPVKKKVVRVTDYKQSLAIESDGASGTKMFMHYFDNPGGSIPTWIINWAAKTGVPKFLDDMQKACRSYCQQK